MTQHRENTKFASLRAYLLGAAAVLTALTTLFVGIPALFVAIRSAGDAGCKNIGLFCGASPPVQDNPAPKDDPDLSPYGIELTALTNPNDAVADAEKAKLIAPPESEIRLYKRLTRSGTIAWAPVVIYTDSNVASNERSKYKGLNDWDADLVTLRTWCPKSRQIPSPTGTPLKISVFDCT
jgi:hypothetical protein